MHIPDGFLNAQTAVASAAVSVGGLGLALRHVRLRVAPARIPMIGLASAFVFAAQMLNFPVAAGTSGHLIGAVLAAVLLGPASAVLVMSTVLILQCLLFSDGGLTALGANLFNMALVAPVAGYGVYLVIRKMAGGSLRSRLLATAFAAWCSTVVAASSCAVQLAFSGAAHWKLVFPAMTGIHMVIGLGEAIITTMVVAAIARTRPELLSEETIGAGQGTGRNLMVFGLLISLGLVIFISPFASSMPDGLEKVATALGFEHQAAKSPALGAPMPDYSIPAVQSVATGTILAGLVGTVLAFVIAWLLARWLAPEKKSPI